MDINPTTDHLTIPIVAASSAAIVLGAAVWRVANFVRDVRDELRSLSAKISIMVTRVDLERWTHRLERENRSIGLNVPPIEQDTNHQFPS